MKLALTKESVAVPMASHTNRAGCKGAQSSTHALDLFRCQITSTTANQYPVLVMHTFLLSSFGSVDGPKLFKRNLPGRQAKDEKARAPTEQRLS